MRVFISYSTANVDVAERLRRDLAACGITVWIDSQAIKVGESIPKKISEGIRDSDYVVLLVSRKSLESRWVEREWLPALHREVNEGRITLLPIVLEDCTLPSILADKRYADFRGGYVAGLADLMLVFTDALIGEHSQELGIKASSLGDLRLLLEAVDQCCLDNHSLRIRQLLRTVLATNDPRKQQFPKWLEGRWFSRLGWNQGSILKCTEQPHTVGSIITYGRAVASFHGFADGVITGALECHKGIAAFRWIQEVGGDMGGAVWDKGWGYFWQVHNALVRSLWWYDDVPTQLPTSDPRSQVHRWQLERMPQGINGA